MNKTFQNMEIERKFQIINNKISKLDFNTAMTEIYGYMIRPFYVVSCDDYFALDISGQIDSFLRYRKSEKFKELTIKYKKLDNFVRKEINLNLSSNDDLDITEFIHASGYKKQFSVMKEAWIWSLENADISYYTVSDGKTFVEIEATKYSSIEEGQKIVTDIANTISNNLMLKHGAIILQPENKSLYEIYKD